jgi:hypothetical protein
MPHQQRVPHKKWVPHLRRSLIAAKVGRVKHVRRGCDVDQTRNLAKSVTVE